MARDGKHYVWCFEKCVNEPPITPESLAELDMPRIINNPKLRHDVNFDRELHFRPNLDGSKGRQKLQLAEDYWKALEAELCILQEAQTQKMLEGNDGYWDLVIKDALVRLPKVFASIRDILKSLVPDYDQKAITDRLDVDHIMQEIRMGMCDLIGLGDWLSRILKNHCAPMRDYLVDAMQQEICAGVLEARSEKLVSGLRQLMAILEAMKLDVANHQIRHMRPLLIDDTINFQRRYNAHRISIGKIDTEKIKTWLDVAIVDLQYHQRSHTPVDALVSALLRDVLFHDSDSICPPSFYLDTDRLRVLRNELHTIIYHAICRDVLKEIALSHLSEVDLARAYDTLSISIAAIVGSQGKFADRLENIAAEIVRVVLVMEGRDPPFDATLLDLTERKLAEYLHPRSRSFVNGAQQLHARLLTKIQSCTHACLRMTAIGLQDMFVPTTTPSRKYTGGGFGAVMEPTPSILADSNDADKDLVRRFTHILVLHWQVWADLVYLVESSETDADDASSSSDDAGSDSATTVVPSVSGSPTIPVAQAVFPPGRKWLPSSVKVTDVPTVLPDSKAASSTPETGGATASSSGSEQSDEQPSPPSVDSQSRQPTL